MGNRGEKAGRGGERGESPGREMRKEKGMKEQEGEKGNGHGDETNPRCRGVPFSIHTASQLGTTGWKQPHQRRGAHVPHLRTRSRAKVLGQPRVQVGKSVLCQPQLWSPPRAGTSLFTGLSRRAREKGQG